MRRILLLQNTTTTHSKPQVQYYINARNGELVLSDLEMISAWSVAPSPLFGERRAMSRKSTFAEVPENALWLDVLGVELSKFDKWVQLDEEEHGMNWFKGI